MLRTCFLVPLLALLAALPAEAAPAASTTIEFTIAAGKHDRLNEPVCVPLFVVPMRRTKVELLKKDGKKFGPAQLTPPSLLTAKAKAPAGKEQRDLHFILPSLKAGKSLTLKAVIAPGDLSRPEGDFFYWIGMGTGWTDLRFGERTVLRYVHPLYDDSSPAMREKTFKVFHHVFAPSGKRVLTNNGPPSLYPHHRGLFYGFMKVRYGEEQVDIWHCKGDTHQAHGSFADLATGEVLGRHRLNINWNGKGKKTFAVEQREVTAYNLPGGTLIDFTSVLKTTGPTIKLDGDPQHAGFHFRAHNDVADKKAAKQTIFIRPDGVDKPGATRNWPAQKKHVNLPWNAMSFVLGGQRYTVAYLDKPTNPKEARFSERDYGRFGSYFVTAVTKDKPVVVSYRLWVQNGLMSVADVAARSTAFVEPVTVTVK